MISPANREEIGQRWFYVVLFDLNNVVNFFSKRFQTPFSCLGIHVVMNRGGGPERN